MLKGRPKIVKNICMRDKFEEAFKMDQSKETKSGILNALKKRFWTSRVSNKSCFKGRNSKHKMRSESSHCNFICSTNDVLADTHANNSKSNEVCLCLNNKHSASEPVIASCIVEPYETVASSSNVESSGIDGSHNVINIKADSLTKVNNISTQNLRLLFSTHLIDSSQSVTSSSSQNASRIVAEKERLPESNEKGSGNSSADPKSSLMCELLKLTKYGWYWGSVTKEEAEEKLADQPDGAFLLRDSSADHFILSLSFRSSGKTLHTRIEYSLDRGQFSFYQQSDETFTSIAELVEHSMSFSQSAVYCYSRPRSPGHPAFPVRLTKPISRFAHVWSLQQLCRFVIRESIRLDNIQKLPLPSKIKDYIEEGHY